MTITTKDLEGRVWFSTTQAATYTEWSTKTITRALQSGELRGQQRGVGCQWRIKREWLDAWMTGEAS